MIEFLHLIDWYAYSPTPPKSKSAKVNTLDAHLIWLKLNAWRTGPHHIAPPHAYKKVASRAPFSHAWQHPETGARISVSVKTEQLYVELPGAACALLTETGALWTIIRQHQRQTSRLDVATDILTDTRPAAWMTAAQPHAAATRSTMKSTEGETEYIGSWASDRYTRVYRYEPPHDRADWLRVETVYRRHMARSAATYVAEGRLAELATSEGKRHGFEHPVWVEGVLGGSEASEAPLWRPEVVHRDTLAWLDNAVAPAMRRLMAEGLLPDPVLWVQRHVVNWHGDE